MKESEILQEIIEWLGNSTQLLVYKDRLCQRL